MRLIDVTVHPRQNGIRHIGLIEKDQAKERSEAYFEFDGLPDVAPGGSADAFAAAMLIPAMKAKETLAITPPISPRLHFNLPRIRDLIHTWYPGFSRVGVQSTPDTPGTGALTGRAATFFSGGVDSFYSLLKHTRGASTLPIPLTHVVFMRGVEIKLDRAKGVDESEKWIREIAASVGVGVVVGETSIRSVLQGSEESIHWERHYHGSALSAVALALSPAFGAVCIPSTFTYNHLVPYGSSPVLDEMFSTERMQVVHDGSEVTRADKVARMIEWDRDLALKYLRVCTLNYGGAFNCGKCYKCVRTAVPLKVLGVWEQASTFPNKDTSHWEAVMSKDHLAFTEENLQFARAHGDAQMVALIERVVRRRKRGTGARTLLENSPFAAFVPILSQLRGRPAAR